MIKNLKLSDLHPHPGNPRLAPREDVVERIAAQLNGGMDEAHALIVRPNGAGYQIVSGHHRALAAKKAGLTEAPCWVREMSDEDAYMALALNNAQGELKELEIGLHALRSKLGASEYARRSGGTQPEIARRIYAAKVVDGVMPYGIAVDPDRWRHLAEIHVAADWAWPALVDAMIEKGWSVEITGKQAAKFKPAKKGPLIPAWINLYAVTALILAGRSDPIMPMIDAVADAEATIKSEKLEADRFLTALADAFQNQHLSTISSVRALINPILNEQQDLIRQKREAEEALAREQEERAEREARLRESVSLKEWRELDEATQKQVLFQKGAGPSFNKQENDTIEWAQWSWNPVTGCLHDCPYCYAHEIALDLHKRMGAEGPYPNAFEPTLRPIQLLAPHSQKPPKQATTDVRFKNVFTCSMADLFGRWVPSEWIDAILTQMRAAPQWNFLCLTKFPKRMAEFDIPENTWMGTTIDLQARVPAAEAAFAKVKASIKWLSIEPMLEPLTFKRLDLFDWIVVGGASKQEKYMKSPDWRPPARWIFDLANQWARAKGSDQGFYAKTNLFGSQCREGFLGLPNGLPIPSEHAELPDIFRYLGKAKTDDQKPER